jgi:hypothetical protein
MIPDATKTAILQPYIGVGKGLIPSSGCCCSGYTGQTDAGLADRVLVFVLVVSLGLFLKVIILVVGLESL